MSKEMHKKGLIPMLNRGRIVHGPILERRGFGGEAPDLIYYFRNKF